MDSPLTQATALPPGLRRMSSRPAWLSWQGLGIWGSLIVLLIVGTALSDSFATTRNLLNVLRQSSIIAIVALGMTYVIVSGGIDLSVGSIVALVSVLTAGLLNSYGLAPALAGAVVAGLAAGLVNGAGIAYFQLPPFIMTLAAMTVYRGLAFIFSGGKPITVEADTAVAFNGIGGGYLFDAIPLPVVYMVVLFVLGHILLRRTRFGVYAYSIGGSEEAARLSGVNVARIKLMVYGLSGLCAALAAIILTSRVTVGEPIAGQMYELEAIAAVVIGGTSLSGGKGGVWGTLAGALILFILLNLFNIQNVPSYYQDVFKGIIIVAAVLMQYKRSNR